MNSSILLVDDEQDFLETTKRDFEIPGYRNLKLLNDPVDAIQLVAAGDPFDSALLDTTMSGMNGLESRFSMAAGWEAASKWEQKRKRGYGYEP